MLDYRRVDGEAVLREGRDRPGALQWPTCAQRLASAADLLKMAVDNLPAPSEVMEMARTLEVAITKAADAGEQGYIGAVVDRVFQEKVW